MLTERLDAAEAGFQVGYDDASHFSREHKRHFGDPPLRDGGVPMPLQQGLTTFFRSIVPLGRAIFLMTPGTSCLATVWEKRTSRSR
jgi:AraC-like DNA-binding protein